MYRDAADGDRRHDGGLTLGAASLLASGVSDTQLSIGAESARAAILERRSYGFPALSSLRRFHAQQAVLAEEAVSTLVPAPAVPDLSTQCAATLVVGPQLQVTCAIPWLDRFRPKRMVLWLVLTGALL